MLHQLIHINYTTVLLIIFLIVFLFSNTTFTKQITNLFSFSTLCVLLLVITDSVEYWTASLDYVHPIRIWVSALGYSLRPVAILNIILIVIRHLNINHKILMIPAIINGLISFSAIFSPIAFSYAPDNEFIRGPLGLLPYFVCGFYLFLLLIITIRYFNERNPYESLILFFMLGFTIFSTYLEVAFHFEGFINAASALCITFYYLFFHTQTSKRDALTQAFNRRCFYDDASHNYSKLKGVISFDLNDLKLLNDNQGHSSGDTALYTIANFIKKILLPGCKLYRTGGDEFMILCFKHNEQELEQFVQKMREEIAKTPYTCAIGFAMHKDNENFDQLCARADAIMYEDKERIKGIKPR